MQLLHVFTLSTTLAASNAASLRGLQGGGLFEQIAQGMKQSFCEDVACPADDTIDPCEITPPAERPLVNNFDMTQEERVQFMEQMGSNLEQRHGEMALCACCGDDPSLENLAAKLDEIKEALPSLGDFEDILDGVDLGDKLNEIKETLPSLEELQGMLDGIDLGDGSTLPSLGDLQGMLDGIDLGDGSEILEDLQGMLAKLLNGVDLGDGSTLPSLEDLQGMLDGVDLGDGSEMEDLQGMLAELLDSVDLGDGSFLQSIEGMLPDFDASLLADIQDVIEQNVDEKCEEAEVECADFNPAGCQLLQKPESLNLGGWFELSIAERQAKKEETTLKITEHTKTMAMCMCCSSEPSTLPSIENETDEEAEEEAEEEAKEEIEPDVRAKPLATEEDVPVEMALAQTEKSTVEPVLYGQEEEADTSVEPLEEEPVNPASRAAQSTVLVVAVAIGLTAMI